MSKIILLGASWCPVTKETRELFEKIQQEEPDFNYQYIDIDSKEGKELVKKLSITDIPKIIFDNEIIFHGKPPTQKAIKLFKKWTNQPLK